MKSFSVTVSDFSFEANLCGIQIRKDDHSLGLWDNENVKNELSQKNVKTCHCWYIEPRNREKSLTPIWQRFSCLLDEWIAKILKENFFTAAFWDNPHYPFWDAHGQSDKSENIFGIWY